MSVSSALSAPASSHSAAGPDLLRRHLPQSGLACAVSQLTVRRLLAVALDSRLLPQIRALAARVDDPKGWLGLGRVFRRAQFQLDHKSVLGCRNQRRIAP